MIGVSPLSMTGLALGFLEELSIRIRGASRKSYGPLAGILQLGPSRNRLWQWSWAALGLFSGRSWCQASGTSRTGFWNVPWKWLLQTVRETLTLPMSAHRTGDVPLSGATMLGGKRRNAEGRGDHVQEDVSQVPRSVPLLDRDRGLDVSGLRGVPDRPADRAGRRGETPEGRPGFAQELSRAADSRPT